MKKYKHFYQLYKETTSAFATFFIIVSPIVGVCNCSMFSCTLLYVDFLFIVTPIVGVCNSSMLCCTLLYVHSSIAIILMGKRGLVALLNLYSLCLVMVERLLFAVAQGCLRFVIVIFPDHTHYF